jgi:hypothetical protein
VQQWLTSIASATTAGERGAIPETRRRVVMTIATVGGIVILLTLALQSLAGSAKDKYRAVGECVDTFDTLPLECR